MQVTVITSTAGQPKRPVRATDQCSDVAGMVIERMPHELDTELILSDCKIVDIAGGNIVIKLVESAVIRQCHDSFLGERRVPFKLSELGIEARRNPYVVATDICRIGNFRN